MPGKAVRSLRITLLWLLIGGFITLPGLVSAHSDTSGELRAATHASQRQSVLLDAWSNSQQRKNASGQMEYFHYEWDDTSDSGFSLLGLVK